VIITVSKKSKVTFILKLKMFPAGGGQAFGCSTAALHGCPWARMGDIKYVLPDDLLDIIVK